jgi:hypothetical protein
VALLVLALGAATAGYEGVNHLLHPEPMRTTLVNYIVVPWSVVTRSYGVSTPLL